MAGSTITHQPSTIHPGGLPLRIRSLSVCFYSPQAGELVWALKNCSLAADAGEVIGITGVSGGGKSTLARAMLGLVDSRPGIVGGRLFTEGANDEEYIGFVPEQGDSNESLFTACSRSSDWKRWRRTFENQADHLRRSGAYLMLQEPRDTLNPYLTIGRILSQTCTGDLNVADALELVELPSTVTGLYPAQLSTGMCQRVHLAMALSSGIRLLIADEPLIRLDMRIRAHAAELLGRIQRERGFTLILLSHDLHLLQKLVTRIYVLEDGRMVEHGEFADLWENAEHDYSRQLFSTFRELFSGAEAPRQRSSSVAEHQDHEEPGERVAKISGVTKQFGKTTAVDDVSLAVNEGECVGLLGESGCGKTTLARLVIGLDTAQEGEIKLNLADARAFRPNAATPTEWRRIRSSLQLIYQDADTALDPESTAGEAVEEAYQIHYPRLTAGERGGLIRSLFCSLHLSEKLLHTKSCFLSGGEARRTIIAQSMAALGFGLHIPDRGRQLLIADEPTTGLDAENCASLISFLDEAKRQMGLTLLIISHDLPILRKLCSRIAVMYSGRIVEQGGPEVIQDASPGMRHPFTEQLMNASWGGWSKELEVREGQQNEVRGTGCVFFHECSHPLRDSDQCALNPPLAGSDLHQIACWFEPRPES
ncbi:MAG: ATP-binding cassette domain-containing protein [Planctomycetota bacterium]|nr:ATP-binding cassette domain-containing protein [Planctomycetota bacterium]